MQFIEAETIFQSASYDIPLYVLSKTLLTLLLLEQTAKKTQ